MTSRRAVSFAGDLSADETDGQTFELDANATVENVSIRIYPTPGGNVEVGDSTLQVTPLLLKEQTGTQEPLVRLNGKDYISGDIDVFEFDVSIPAEKDDKISVQAVNPAGNGDFTYRMSVEVDYRGGTQSIEML